jgi:hypothetical protein
VGAALGWNLADGPLDLALRQHEFFAKHPALAAAMDFIDPLQGSRERVVLAGLYPFLHAGGTYDTTLAGSLLKAECLVQPECSIPGSMVLEEPSLRTLCLRNADLIRAGTLVLDLRSTVKSFRALALEKFGKDASDEIRKTADYLDEICPKVLAFNPTDSSARYTVKLREFLIDIHEKSDTGLEKKATDRLIDNLLRRNELLSLNDALRLKTNIAKIDRKIEAAAKFFYCVSPVDSLNSFVQLPEKLWHDVNSEREHVYVPSRDAKGYNDLSVAHRAVLRHFAVAIDALSRLTAEDVVELRSDGATRRAIEQMRTVVDDVHRRFAAGDEQQPETVAVMQAIEDEIAALVQDKALAQARRAGAGEAGGMAADEIASQIVSIAHQGIPGAGLVRPLVLRLGRVLSRKVPAASWADLTLSPLQLYVSRLQQRIAGQPSHGIS